MKLTLKIAKAEIASLFYSPIAWFLCIILLIQCALTYTGNLGNYIDARAQGDLNHHFFTRNIIGAGPNGRNGIFPVIAANIYLYIPLLTMGLISRERSSGTIKLLYSSPITTSQIIFGKYGAMLVFNLLLVALIGIFGLLGLFNIYAADGQLILSGLLGIFLLLCAYTAIGLFMSCLTAYQVVAAISTLVVFTILDRIGGLWQGVGFVRDLTYFLSIGDRTGHLSNGLISTKDIAYFLLIVGMFLAFSIIRLQSERGAGTGIKAAAKYVAVFTLVLALGYVSSRQHLIAYYDATAPKTNTISPNTQRIMKGLDKGPIKMTTYVNLLGGLYEAGQPSNRNNELGRWESYRRFKSDIDINYVYYYDVPLDDPNFWKNNPGKSLEQIAQLEIAGRHLDPADFKTPEQMHQLVDLKPELNRYVTQVEYNGKKTFLRMFNDMVVYPGENEVGAALKRLTTTLPKIVFAQGEMERTKELPADRDYGDLTSLVSFRNALVNQGFDVESVDLHSKDIPSGIAGLVIADPRNSFKPEVLDKIRDYIARGGNLFVAGEPGRQAILNPLLQSLGVQLLDGTLVQKSKTFAPGLTSAYLSKEAVGFSADLKRNVKDSLFVMMPKAAALSLQPSGPFHIVPLLLTDARHSWLKGDKLDEDTTDVAFDAARDKQGAFPTALALTRQVGGKEQRIIVTGDADFLSNSELSRINVPTSNFQFGTDLFGWFTYGEFPINTQMPEPKDNGLTISDGGFNWLKLFLLGGLPGMALIAGAVFLIRRKRA